MTELTIPKIDFSTLGNLGKTYRDARTHAMRAETLAELGRGTGPLDYDDAVRKLLAIGDSDGARSLATLALTIEQRRYQRSRDAMRDRGRGSGAATDDTQHPPQANLSLR